MTTKFLLGVAVGVLLLGGVLGFVRYRGNHDSGITLRGAVLAQGDQMIYEGGTPSKSLIGGIDNGCSGYMLAVGTTVTISDAQGKPVAKGAVTETFYWPDGPTLMVSKVNHGCSFSYKVSDVPKLDAYDVSVGFESENNVTQVSLRYYDDWQGEGPYYEIPPITAKH
jgi:hypothetical protein